MDEVVKAVASESLCLDKCPGKLLLIAGKYKIVEGIIIPAYWGKVVDTELSCKLCQQRKLHLEI